MIKTYNKISFKKRLFSVTYKIRVPRTGHGCLVRGFDTVIAWGNKRPNDDDGTQTNDTAGTLTQQQQLLAKRHIRCRLDRSGPWRVDTSCSDIATQSWYPMRQSTGDMCYQ